MEVHKLLGWKTQSVHVAVPDFIISVEIEDLGVQVGDLERDEIRSGIDLKVGVSRKREVRGGGHEL